MKAQEAQALGERIAALTEAGKMRQGYTLLAPTLAQRTPFPILGRIGDIIGRGSLQEVNALLELIAADGAEGGWVVIGTALGAQLDRDMGGAFERCRRFLVRADVWYGADILGERVPGPALCLDLPQALDLLGPWREDANRWVRRTLGIAVHFWARRSRGAAADVPHARALLTFLEPLFSEWDMDAVKGAGWGLKTLGRHYPELVAAWLEEQVVVRKRRHRALMLRKALTYLSEEQRARATGESS